MTQKRWRFTVSDLGSATANHDLTVEASDWVTALTRARAQIGERGGVPPGAMCNVTADGKVMLMDAVGRKQYRLEPTTAVASVKPAAPSVPVPAPVVPGPTAKRAPRPTMAYTSPGAVAAVQASIQAQAPIASVPVVEPVAAAPAPMAAAVVPSPSAAPVVPSPSAAPVVPSPSAVQAPAPVTAEPSKRPRAATVAYTASDTLREPTIEPPVPALVDPTLPEASGSVLSAMAGASKLYERDAEPTKESPLLYRERHYFVPETVSNEEARAILLQLFEELRESIAARPKGKLVKMAVFDHAWTGQPQRPPFLSLQWKDWRGEPEVVDGPRELSAEAQGRAQAEREMQERMEEQARLAEEEQRILELQEQARAEEARMAALQEQARAEEARVEAARIAALQAEALAEEARIAAREAQAQAEAQARADAAQAQAKAAQAEAEAQAKIAEAKANADAQALAPQTVGGWQSAVTPAPSVPPPAMPSVMVSPELLAPEQAPMPSVMVAPELLAPQPATPMPSVMVSPELAPQPPMPSVMIAPELVQPAIAPVAQAAPAPQAPAPIAQAAVAQSAPVGKPRVTPATLGDDRLADAFEGLQDLAFLQTPLEAAEFVVRLLGELIPCEAASVALYDINANEMRFVASSGVGAAERKGDAVPTNVGILGRALLSYVRPTRVNDVSADAAFDPGVDGRVGLEVHTLMAKPLAVGERLLGAVQLLNRRNDFEFSLADENLLVYVAERLSDFLEKAKARGNPKRSVAR